MSTQRTVDGASVVHGELIALLGLRRRVTTLGLERALDFDLGGVRHNSQGGEEN